jgi:hypothetical protein
MTARLRSFGVYSIAPFASIAMVVMLAVFDPATNAVFPPCLFRAATGLLCPGCGSARAIHALAHGDLRTALQMNVATVIAIPVVASDVLQAWLDPRGGWMSRLRPISVWTIAGGLILYGVLRNVVR